MALAEGQSGSGVFSAFGAGVFNCVGMQGGVGDLAGGISGINARNYVVGITPVAKLPPARRAGVVSGAPGGALHTSTCQAISVGVVKNEPAERAKGRLAVGVRDIGCFP